MFPPNAPWSGLGQLESEISLLKSEVSRKAESYEIHSINSRLDSFECSLREIRSDIDSFRIALQELQTNRQNEQD
jgi:hypothetical protein